MDTVESLETELGFEGLKDDLRRVQGFWKQLQAARTKAAKDARALPAYRKLLTLGIAQVRQTVAQETPLADEALKQANRELWTYYDQCRVEFGIAGREAMRVPSRMEDWAEKWLQMQWEAYRHATQQWTERGTPAALAALKQAMHTMMQAYAGT